MGAPINAILAIEDVLTTERAEDTGAILAQCGDVIGEKVSSQKAEIWQPQGYVSRPARAQPGKSAAQAINIKRSDQDLCIAIRDVRALKIAGSLKDGETCLFAPGSDGNAQGCVLLKQDGSISLITTDDNTEAGKTCQLRFGPDGLTITWPFCSLRIDADGVVLTHTAGFVLSALKAAGIPAPFSTLIGASVDIEVKGAINLNGSKVTLGPSPTMLCAIGLPTTPGSPTIVPPTIGSSCVQVTP